MNQSSLGQNPNQWIPDSQAMSCAMCFRNFTWRYRKHHCRLCGQVFCNNCSGETCARIDNGAAQKVRLCTKCCEINTNFNKDLERNQPLLLNQLSAAESRQRNENYFEIIRRGSILPENSQNTTNNEENTIRNPDTVTSEDFNNFEFEKQNSIYQQRLTMSNNTNRQSIIEDLRSDFAQKSEIKQNAIQQYLKQNHYGGDFGMNEVKKAESELKKVDFKMQDKKVALAVNKNFDLHVQNMVKLVMEEFQVSQEKWYEIMHTCTRKTVLTVRPTSILLNDPIDINAFVKIVTVHHPSQNSGRFVNGIVFKKDIANRRMRSNIEKPRILLLANSLGYVQEDGLALVDLEREIEQEEALIRIIQQKIAQVNPDVIFVEKDASRMVLDMLLNANRTVITNTSPKMLVMIARCTQTIICPNSNFISKGFKIGECVQFKIEQTKGVGQNAYQQPTNLMCLEGCRSELGCTVVLSGPDAEELKRVRHAMKKCIALARSLFYECEYLKFLKPNLNFEVPTVDIADDQQLSFDDTRKSGFSINDGSNEMSPDMVQAPFLFEKMMERQSLIFEHFSLAFPQKNIYDQIQVSDSQTQPIPTQTYNSQLDHGENENEIKRKLKKMCNKPVRSKIDFYSLKNDVSVFTMIKRLAKQSITNCKADQCFKSRLAHTDYWYHGNGCVEIKFMLTEGTDKNVVQKQLDQVQQILIYAYCQKCQSRIIKKRPAPIELLEMSFFKFLEQFFYNQEVTTTNVNDKGKPCPHSFHLDCSLLFKYGPVKIMFQFEQLDEYTLDLIHFGLTPGIFRPAEIKAKVQEKLVHTMIQFKAALHWIDENTNLIAGWVTDATEELPPLLGQELKPQLQNLLQLVSVFKADFVEFYDSITKRLFHSDQYTQFMQKITSQTQQGRLATLISQRVSEYLFILRKVWQYITDGIFNRYFTKKQTLQQFMAHDVDDSFVSVREKELSGSILQFAQETTQKNQREPARSDISGIRRSHYEEPQQQQPQLGRFGTMLDTVLVQDKMAGPSTQLKSDFRKILEFENELVTNDVIKELTSHCAALPLGYNQGSVRVQPYDFTSLIAMTLNSNLYLSGLMLIDYMEMNEEKVVDFEPKSEDRGKGSQPQFLQSKMVSISLRDKKGANQTVAFSKNHDVLNQHVPFALAEAELSKQTSVEMILDFSTFGPPSMCLKQDKDFEMIISDERGNTKQFYDALDPIVDLGSYLEQPVNPKLFEMLESLTVNQHNAIVRPLDQKNVEKNGGIPKQLENHMTAEVARSDIYHLYHEQFEFSIKVYFPGHFEALRKIYCGAYQDFIQSFCESYYWKDNSGGKSRSTFFMSSCQKYVIKQVKGSEIKMFEEMSSSYFEYLKESFARQCPTTIAKTLGIFKIKIRMESKARSESFYLLVMENLLIGVDEGCVRYDLKGSRRNRYITKKSDQPNQVTLDFNFLQDLKSRPIPLQYSMKRILNLAIHNDSLYLSKQSIIDYSMFVIINHKKKTVRLGIIDYIQQYTIEKQIESYLKAGIAAEEPTIISPEAYKLRFRTAMDKYFIALVPDRDRNMRNIMRNLFSADKIKWFTKETDKSVV